MSKVFYSSFSKPQQSWLDKASKLFDKAGFKQLIDEGDKVAIKLHFGEPGNTAFLSPIYVRRIVDKIKAAGGKPFLTDANTLYVGRRSNAVDHITAAIENGFSYATVGAPIIIADGLNGKDFFEVTINAKHVEKARIGSAAYLADAMIVLTHFKGHELTGFGGAIKNIGMGLGSRSGKQIMHSDMLPYVEAGHCMGCEKCIKWCPANAISINEEGVATIDEAKCLGCGECTVTCPNHAIAINWKTEARAVQEKIVEYAYAAIKDKPSKVGFLNFVMNVSPNCDCWGWNESPIVPDIGILASTDPVAIDQASVDLVNEAQSLVKFDAGKVSDTNKGTEDKFILATGMDWRPQLEYGEEIGLGSRNYTLVKD